MTASSKDHKRHWYRIGYDDTLRNMKKEQQQKTRSEATADVRKWWDENPFTLGVATGDYKKHDLVGRQPVEKMDIAYFREIDRRFRKHMGLNVQKPGKPLLSGVIDFDADIKGKKVLDIATGSGLHTVEFAAAGAEVTGIDLTPFAVMQTKKNLEARGLSAKVVEMDAQRMDLPADYFDFVNAWGCLMHMPDTEKAMSEICRVLKPGGRAFAYMYNRNSWPFWFNIILLRGVLLGGLLRYKGNITRLTSRYSDGASTGGNMLTKFYTTKQVESMFRAAGFSKTEAFPLDLGYEADHWPMNSFPVFKFLPKAVKAWMGKRWGYGLVVWAQK